LSDRNPYAPPTAEVRDAPHPAADAGNLASRKLRFIGALVDAVANGVLYLPVLVSSGLWQQLRAGQLSFGETLFITLGSLATFILINGYLLATAGQTIGKRMVGTRIVNVFDERKPKFLTLVGARYGATWLLGLIPGIGGLYRLVDVLFIFRNDRRCLHDWIAGTKVINAQTASTASSASD
jgi:uncharacterized RDD family membrane protein YckC